MILVDTTVIVKYWCTSDSNIRSIIEREDMAVCGVVRAELLHGAANENDFERIVHALSSFENVKVTAETWDLLGRNLYVLRTHGLTLPFQDALLATVALQQDLFLWSYDKHFKQISEILADLRLFDETDVGQGRSS